MTNHHDLHTSELPPEEIDPTGPDRLTPKPKSPIESWENEGGETDHAPEPLESRPEPEEPPKAWEEDN